MRLEKNKKNENKNKKKEEEKGKKEKVREGSQRTPLFSSSTYHTQEDVS
jgi:hypothetical protein